MPALSRQQPDLATELKNPNSLLYKSVATLVSAHELAKQVELQLATQQANLLSPKETKEITPDAGRALYDQMVVLDQQTQQQQLQQQLLQQSMALKVESMPAYQSLLASQKAVQAKLADIEFQQKEIINAVLGTNTNKTAEQINEELEAYNSTTTTTTELTAVSRLLRNNNEGESKISEVSNENNLVASVIKALSKFKLEYNFQQIISMSIQTSLKSVVVVHGDINNFANTSPLTNMMAMWKTLSNTSKNSNVTEEDDKESLQTTTPTPFSTTP
jgi:hypothetical protein